jgi:transglutaminase-like putative cysteine protease
MQNGTRSIIILAMTTACALDAVAEEGGRAKRDVLLTYTATLKDIPAGATAVDLWLPVAQDCDGQKVTRVTVAYPEGGAIAAEPRYGNKMWHKRFVAPFTTDLHDGALGAEIVFEIHRTEIVVAEAKSLGAAGKMTAPERIYLEANKLIPIDIVPVTKIATNLQLEGQPPIRAARKMYDWLIDEFTYNHKARGAGRGDVVWACDAKSGDCGDYNSTFIAVMRSQGIPADHEFGFPIRTQERQGKLPYYHCWSRFQVEGIGWIPTDPSEADKHPELRAYYFGSQSADMMKFTHGRDVTLVPPQAGPPLNKFIFPYAEVDGKEHARVTWALTFKDIDSSGRP